MYRTSRLFVAVLAASLLLALGASTATAARSFSLNGGGQAILAISARFTFEGNNGVRVANGITLHGSLHGAIAKTSGSLAGVVTSVLFGGRGECASSVGIGCVAAPLPGNWHLQLVSFTGTLPRIRTIRLRIVGVAILITLLETPQCLYRGDIEGELSAREEAGGQVFESIVADESRGIERERILREELFRRCPEAARFIGSLRLGRAISIRLV
jgi:hypothetical protein